jgi:hypothetical protein
MMVCVAAIVSTVILEMETPVIIYNFNELLTVLISLSKKKKKTVLISTRICSSLYFLVPFYMTGGILLKAFILFLFSIASHFYTFDCNFRKTLL